MPTAVISVREMLVDRVKSDAGLLGMLSAPGVYARRAPPSAALPYIELAGTTESPVGAGYYNRKGHRGTEEIKCWAKSIWTAQQIFARLSELLDDQRPVISGHVVMKGVLEYVTDGEDPDKKSWQVWARYRIRSLVAA